MGHRLAYTLVDLLASAGNIASKGARSAQRTQLIRRTGTVLHALSPVQACFALSRPLSRQIMRYPLSLLRAKHHANSTPRHPAGCLARARRPRPVPGRRQGRCRLFRRRSLPARRSTGLARDCLARVARERAGDTSQHQRFNRLRHDADQFDPPAGFVALRHFRQRPDGTVRERIYSRVVSAADDGQIRLYMDGRRRIPLRNSWRTRSLCTFHPGARRTFYAIGVDYRKYKYAHTFGAEVEIKEYARL